MALACAGLGGCSSFTAPTGTTTRSGGTSPTGGSGGGASAQGSGAGQASKLAQAQATHEYPSPPPPPESSAGGSASPLEAVRDFAYAYINWTADTVSGDMRALAARSVGQARSAMTLAAAQTAQDYELQRGGIANRGTVEAIAPLAGHPEQYVVVTRELTSAVNTALYDGLRPAWHLALATVLQLHPGQWVLSGWQPES